MSTNKRNFIRRSFFGAVIIVGILALVAAVYASIVTWALILIVFGPTNTADSFVTFSIILMIGIAFGILFKFFYYDYWKRVLENAANKGRIAIYAILNFLSSVLLIVIITIAIFIPYLTWNSVHMRSAADQEAEVLAYTRENFDELKDRMVERKNAGEYPCIYIKQGSSIQEISYKEFLDYESIKNPNERKSIAIVCDYPILYKNSRHFSTCFPSDTHQCSPMRETVDGTLVE